LLPQAQRDDLRARKVDALEVLRLFEWDHVILHAHGGSDFWHNIDPKLIAVHHEKSRRDTAIVAKGKRLDARWREFTRKMAQPKTPQPPKQKITLRCKRCSYKVRSVNQHYAEVKMRQHMWGAHGR
jgi:hypothetical protein